MPDALCPGTLDRQGATNLPFIRQGQLRATADTGGGLNRPVRSGTPGSSATTQPGRQWFRR